MVTPTYSCLTLSLDGFMLSYSMSEILALTPRQIKKALDSPVWHEYERGKVPQSECYEMVTKTFGCDPESFNESLRQLEESRRPNMRLINAIQDLRSIHPELKVFGIVNRSKPDFEELEPVLRDWGIFDEVYPSSVTGYRIPDSTFFDMFLNLSMVKAKDCIFVDTYPENVTKAQSIGFRGLLFDETEAAVIELHNLLGDPLARGLQYLRQNAKSLFCETNTGLKHLDNYSQLLILQCIEDRSLVTLEKKGATWNYFIGKPMSADTVFPDDADTTSLAMLVLNDIPIEERELAMQKILSNRTIDGLPLCYFDESRPRFDHNICACVYHFFHLQNQGSKLSVAYSYLCSVLRTKAYVFGSYYYYSPDWFLYVLTGLCAKRPFDSSLKEMRDLLILEVRDRMGCDKDTFNAAMRLVNSQSFDMANPRDLETILRAQQADGGWERVWLWRYGKEASLKVGSRGVITAMAVKGIQMARQFGTAI